MTDTTEPKPVNRAGLRRQIATPHNDILVPVFGTLMQPTDDVLISQGGGRGVKIYDELQRDPLVNSLLEKRKRGLIARPWTVTPGGTRRQDKKAAELAELVLDGRWGLSFDRLCWSLLDATLKGYAVVELIWDLRDGFWVPVGIGPLDQRRFVFDVNSRPRLLTLSNPLLGEELPDNKFLVHRFGDNTGDPYGRGLGHQLFWWVFFKRMGMQFWLNFGEKFGSPTVVGEVPDTTSSEEEDILLGKLLALAQQTALTVPEGTVVKFLEAVRSGTVTYPELVAYCDLMITIGISGETLTTSVGSSGGNRALGEVHQDVRDEVIDADSDMLSDSTLNSQLMVWLTRLNYPDAAPPLVYRPRPQRDEDEAKKQQEQLKARQAALEFCTAMRRAGWQPEDPGADITEQWQGRWTYTGVVSGPTAPQSVNDPAVDPGSNDPTRTPPPALASPEGHQPGAVAHLTSQLDDLAGGAMDVLIGRIRAMLDRVETLEEAQAALADLYPDMKVDDLARTIGRAMALANLTGRADV